jgi:hypothetical protein
VFALSNPGVTHGSSLLMISESLGAVCAVQSMCHPEELFVDDVWVPRGCLRCRIHTSPVEVLLLMIFQSLGAVWAVQSMRHPWEQFVDDF